MATSGCGIWTRKLPDDVLEKMSIINLNIHSPQRFSYNKEYQFELTNASLYYGKNITSVAWNFPGATEVIGADTDHPKVKYNKYAVATVCYLDMMMEQIFIVEERKGVFLASGI